MKKSQIFKILGILSVFIVLVLIFYRKSDWTYIDPIENFQLELPRSWAKVQNYPDSEKRLEEKNMRKIYFSTGSSEWGTSSSIIIIITSNAPLERPPKQYYLNYENKTIEIEGIIAEKITTKEEEEIISIDIYFKKNERFFAILISSQKDNSKDLLERIISTFNFIK